LGMGDGDIPAYNIIPSKSFIIKLYTSEIKYCK
jgi:hypothetical protein